MADINTLFRRFLFICILTGCILPDLTAKGDSTDLVCTTISTERIMLLNSTWSESSNAASLSCFNCERGVAKAWLGYLHESGNYRLFQEPDETNRYGFHTNGYSAVGKWRFYGSFNYFSETDGGISWVNVIEPYNGNPYTVGDSVGGDYWKEYYTMEGKATWMMNGNFSAGIDVKYRGGVGTKRKDPRPENTITDFEITPGVIWNSGKLRLGASLRIESGKEDIEFTSVTGNKFDLFYFRGLGAFSTTMDDDGRYSETRLFGGGIQGNYVGNSVDNLTTFHFNRKTTDIKRGDTYPLQVVFLDEYLTEAASVFLFNPGSKNINRLRLNYNQRKAYGQEPVVEPNLEEISYQWSTAAKYTLYWQSVSDCGFSYSYFKGIDRHHFNWGATLNGKYSTEITTYYFVPEFNRQKINLISMGASFEKSLLTGQNHLVMALSGGFRHSPKHSLEIAEDEVLIQKIQVQFVHHDYEYNRSDVWDAGLQIDYASEIRLKNMAFQLFVEAGFKKMTADFHGKSGRDRLFINTGITF